MAWINDIMTIIVLGFAAIGCWAVVTRRLNRALIVKGYWYLLAISLGFLAFVPQHSAYRHIAVGFVFNLNCAVLLMAAVFVLKHVAIESWIVLRTIYVWARRDLLA